MQIATFQKNNWKRLITEIEHRRVVPVIGVELLDVSIKGKPIPLYTHIAQELAVRLDVDGLGKCSNLSKVVYEYSRHGCDPSLPYYEVWDILQDLKDIELPKSLCQLAQIEPFDLFISTTCDDFMAKAVNHIRFNGESKTRSLSFRKRGSIEDIPPNFGEKKLDPPVVYHVFGRANTLPVYVINEENLLEFGHHWQDRDRRPQRLVANLKDKILLILGCSFQNWLSRFFLCALKTDQLFLGKQQQGVVADEKTLRDRELSYFFTRCHTPLYPEGCAIQFVTELAARWHAYASNKPTGTIERYFRESAENTFKKGSFFISYAKEDRKAAALIKQHLESSGLDVWFDVQRLELGDQFKRKILHNIQQSAFFLPIISKHVVTSERRFFRFEWAHAIEETQYRPAGLPFIMPLVIDDTSETAPYIPDEFSKVQWQHLPEGNVSQKFLDLCKRHIRDLRREEEAVQ